MSIKNRKSALCKFALIASTAMLLTACGGDSEESRESADGLFKVTVSTVPSVDAAPLYYAIESGLFEEYNLDVTIEAAPDVPSSITAVASGNADFTSPSLVGGVAAVSEGLPIKAIGPFNAASTEPDTDELVGVIAKKSSGIKTASDLAGKKVAVNSLNSIGILHVSGAMEAEGGDWEEVEFVAVPFQQMTTALLKGQIDAMWSFDPFLTLALDEDSDLFKLVKNPAYLTQPGAPMGGWFTSDQMLESNRDVVGDFQAAMTEANAAIEGDLELNREYASKATEMDPALIERISLAHFPAETPMSVIESTVELIARYGLVDETPSDFDWVLSNPLD